MGADTTSHSGQHELRGTLPAGTRLRNYELISVLGHGGFGITYYARDTTLGREVAVKEYLPTSLALRENGTTVVPRSTQLAEDFIWGRERFLEEARISGDARGRSLDRPRLRLPRSQRNGLHGDGAGARRDARAAPEARQAVAGARSSSACSTGCSADSRRSTRRASCIATSSRPTSFSMPRTTRR